MTELTDKHVIITGGGSGVGASIAQLFASVGAKVTILGRRQAQLNDVANKIGALALTCDVTNRTSLDTALNQARAKNGPASIAIANAGAAVSQPFSKMSSDDLDSMLQVNLMGVFNTWQTCLADMQKQQWGRLIAIASTAGLKGYPYVSGYCAAKHGVIGLTRSVALDLAKHNITANSICPGFVDTPLLRQSISNIVAKTGLSVDDAERNLKRTNPQDRFIEPEEIAQTALWLAQNSARSINGQAISINGGEL